MGKALVCLVALMQCLNGALGAVYQHSSELSKTSYDFIIVGGGNAGAVVANRLTENQNFDVLLIEAGPTNEGVLDAMIPGRGFPEKLQKTIYDWNYTTVPMAGLGNRSLDYPRGLMLGGCSSHNGMFYTRGSMDDYDRWAGVTGDAGWSWNRLLPYFKKNERWSPPADKHNTRGQFNPSVHGFDGLMFTSLPGSPQTIDEMVLQVPNELPDQFPFLLDLNAGKPLGVGWFQGSTGNGTRSSSATAYLSAKFTSRKNLHVLLNTKVHRIATKSGGSIPTFNSIEIDGAPTMFTARKEVILSAGPINTPQLLMNSGIGDRKELQKLKIPTILDLPSVGKNLTDHPVTTLIFTVNSNQPLDDLNTNTTLQALALEQWEFNRTGPYVDPATNFIMWLRLSEDSAPINGFGDPSSGPNTPHLEFVPFSASSTEGQPGHTGGIAFDLITPISRGSVSLNTTDPFGKPIIDLGFFNSRFDILAMVEAYKLSQAFYKAPVWKDYIIAQIVPPLNSTEAELEDYIRTTSSSTSHAVGTAAMSAEHATYGVVNPDLRVKGATGLRIVDASVMPFLVAGHPQAAVYAIAERASDLIKASWA